MCIRDRNIPGILIGNIVLFVLFGLANERFLSSYNIMMIFRNTCTLLMAALGFTLVILIGKIDMSVGSVVSMAAVSVVVLYNAGVPVALALLLPLLIGIAVGVINGLLIAKCNFDFWVVTFGMMSVFAGLALVTTDGNTVAIKNDIVNWIGNGKIAGIYVVIWITVILAALMVWIQKKTKFGYDVFALGGSQAVASVSGINVVKTSIIVYALSGLFAALAGVLIACMTNSGSPAVGVDYTFNAMAAIVIGGTPFKMCIRDRISIPPKDGQEAALKSLIMNQITLHGVRANPNCSKIVLDLMAQGSLNVKDQITHRFPMEQIHEAFDTFIGRKDGALKVIVHPNGDC